MSVRNAVDGSFRFARSLLHYPGSIQAKIFVTFAVVVLLSITAVSLTMYLRFSRTIETNAVTYVSDSVTHANENFEMIFGDIVKISTVLVTSNESVIDPVVSRTDPVSYEGFRERQNAESFLASLLAYKTYISRIAVIGLNGNIFSAGGNMLFRSVVDQPWFAQAAASKDKQILIDAPERGSISFTRIIRRNNQPVGVAMIDFDKAFIGKIFDIKPVAESLFYVADPLGNIIFRPERADAAAGLQESELATYFEAPHEAEPKLRHQVIALHGDKYMAVQYVSETTGWLTLGLIPYHTLLKEAADTRRMIVQLALVVFILVLLVSIALSNRMTHGLKHLSLTMRKVREGNLRARPRVRSRDEIGELSEGFNRMMNNIDALMHDIVVSEKGKRDAELAALQAQIKPHFIYNTLGTIHNLARMQGVRNIEELTGSFVDLLRMTLGHTREVVTIREELRHLQAYIGVQRYKYLDRIEFAFEVEEDVLEFLTIKLVLQPIVENALIHGAGDTDKPLRVTVRIYGEFGRIKFEVTDNGIGMTAGQIERAMETGGGEGSFSSMGIKNVHERIRMTYGDEYGLKLISEPGMYTTVELAIPIVRRQPAQIGGRNKPDAEMEAPPCSDGC